MSDNKNRQRLEEIEKRREWYADESVRIIRQIDNPVILMKIYTVAKTHLRILNEKGGTA